MAAALGDGVGRQRQMLHLMEREYTELGVRFRICCMSPPLSPSLSLSLPLYPSLSLSLPLSLSLCPNPTVKNARVVRTRPVCTITALGDGVRRQRQMLHLFENNYFTEMCSGSEAGSYLRFIDFVYH